MQYDVQWEDKTGTSETEESGDILVLEEKAWFPASQGPQAAPINWWQMGAGYGTGASERAAAVYACRKVIAEEVSRLLSYHYRVDDSGGRVRLRSQLSRVLRYPNSWQSRVDFWLNMLDMLLRDGNAYALAGRNETGAIDSLTRLRSAHPYVDYETGLIFYGVGVDASQPLPEAEDIDPSQLVPASEILHLRLFTPVDPLMGESPLVAAAIAANTGTAISNSTFNFFNRSARPSGYLKHPKRLSPTARQRLKDAWQQNYSGTGTGGTAVLEEGVEWNPMSMSAVDAEIVEQYKMSVADIARVFRVPLFMLGDMDKATFSNVEQMTRSFVAGGLGFYVSLIEEGLARFFGLPLNEGVQFDVEGGLLRAEFQNRVDGLTKGIQGGLFAPNEARRREGLPEVAYGDQPLVQQQMVPFSYAAQQTVPDAAPPAAPAEEPAPTEDEARDMARRMLKVAA